MNDHELRSLSPLDGRYHDKTKVSRDHFSELALIKTRIKTELYWLRYLLDNILEIDIDEETKKLFDRLALEIPDDVALRVKEIEKKTNHDVKAVELSIAELLNGKFKSLVHFLLTSEDVNSLSYALIMKEANKQFAEKINAFLESLNTLKNQTSGLPMLAKTHGQPASPTTLGKELNVFYTRLNRQKAQLEDQRYFAKWAGATGNYNAHVVALNGVDWPNETKNFLSEFGIEHSNVSTQIESHDFLAETFQNLIRINNILLDFSQDIWMYISLEYFSLKKNDNEVGSSTMPHKVNPIDFENAEGNLGLSTAIFNHLANKLPVSRLQRDLSDSTVMRNIGVAYGHLEIALNSLEKGVSKLKPNIDKIKLDLVDKYEILGEAIQSFLRLEGNPNGYEEVKKLTRGKALNKDSYIEVVNNLVQSKEYKSILLELTPEKYIGLAEKLAEEN